MAQLNFKDASGWLGHTSGVYSNNPCTFKNFFSGLLWVKLLIEEILHQLRLVAYPIIYDGFCTFQVVFLSDFWLPSTDYRVVKGGGPRGGGSLIFPKVPQSSQTESEKGSPVTPPLEHPGTLKNPTNRTRWWFQIFFIFIPIWGRFPI